MRAVADSRETIVEFSTNRRYFRLILPSGKPRFSLEKLTRGDVPRFWIHRWEPYGLGTYAGNDPTNAITTTGNPLPARLIGRISSALRFVSEGPLSGKGVPHV